MTPEATPGTVPETILAAQSRLLVLGDVHGARDQLARALDLAAREGRFPVLLGDLVDRGADSAGCLALALPLVIAGRAAWVRGNHDDKLARHLAGNAVRVGADLAETLRQIQAHPGDLATLFRHGWAVSRNWLRWRDLVFTHGAFAPEMLTRDAALADRRGKTMTFALYGQATGELTPEGKPVRAYGWIDTIPEGLTVVVGHDVRAPEVLRVGGAQGGRAVFLDTGAGKGGGLSSLALPEGRVRRHDQP